MDNIKKAKRRTRAKFRIRKRVSGTTGQPRLSVFRSLSQIYAQVIDDVTGKTLVSASSFEKETRDLFKGKTKVEVSFEIGKRLAEKALTAGVKTVVFDRNGYAYHGRVKSLADGAREGGLVF